MNRDERRTSAASISISSGSMRPTVSLLQVAASIAAATAVSD